VRALHYLLLAWRSWQALLKRRPSTLWLQLPQTPLLWLALLYRVSVDSRLRIVADCHNAMFQPPWSRLPGGQAALLRADLVLVHNADMLDRALALGLPLARVRVLEDVPPRRTGQPPAPQADDTEAPVPALFAGRPRPWVVFAGSYGRDEPVAELLAAARLAGRGTIAVTGRLSNARRNGHDLSAPPANVVLTDYLPVAEFDRLLALCDLVLAFTRFDGIQLSVCNEALGFGKPLVMSATPLLQRLFGGAAVAVDSADPASIDAGIERAWIQREALAAASCRLAGERRRAWCDGPLLECLRVLQAASRGAGA
jgi:glycosyltransferase involved in cell wall biosynthesis